MMLPAMHVIMIHRVDKADHILSTENYFFDIPRNFENIIRPKNQLDLDPFSQLSPMVCIPDLTSWFFSDY